MCWTESISKIGKSQMNLVKLNCFSIIGVHAKAPNQNFTEHNAHITMKMPRKVYFFTSLLLEESP